METILFFTWLKILSFKRIIDGPKTRLRSICGVAQLCSCCAFLLFFYVSSDGQYTKIHMHGRQLFLVTSFCHSYTCMQIRQRLSAGAATVKLEGRETESLFQISKVSTVFTSNAKMVPPPAYGTTLSNQKTILATGSRRQGCSNKANLLPSQK